MIHPNIDKYLKRYADLASALGDLGPVDHVVVIPALAETERILPTLEAIPRPQNATALVVVVVNHGPNAVQSVKEDNAQTLALLEEHYPHCTARAIPMREGLYVCVIDHASPGRELATPGVGTARKMGGDFALQAYSKGLICSNILHMTDADARLPQDYFERCNTLGADVGVALFPFVHHAASDVSPKRAHIYDLWLRHYVGGLQFAGSPYAYHAIGSTIATRFESYATVRGMPKKEAAEDFHFLNKLAKTTSVCMLEGAPMSLEARYSDRVPFGTGFAVSREDKSGEDAPIFYDPQIYLALQALMQCFEAMAVLGGGFEACLHGTCPAPLVAPITQAMNILGLQDALEHICRGRKSISDRLRALHIHFDALRTLRFVHTMRDLGFASRPYRELPVAEKAAPGYRRRLLGVPTLGSPNHHPLPQAPKAA